MNHEANRERLKNYSDRTGHKVEYNDGGVMEDNHMKLFSPANRDEDRLNREAHKKALQDKTNRAPEFNRGLNLRNQPVRI
jgi:hypothetical protein